MPVFRYAPRGQQAPPAPPINPHTFAHTTHPYVRGAEGIGKISQQPLTIRQPVSSVYEGRLVGFDVEPAVGMLVVHTVTPTKGCGRITKVLRVRNDRSKAATGGACRVDWDIGHGHSQTGGREGYSTGSKGQYSLAMVAMSLRNAAEAEARDEELALVAKRETLKVGKHAPPHIGVRVLMAYQPGLQRSFELGTICYVSNGYECARVVWDDSGYSPTLYCTGFKGKYQLDLSTENGATIPLSRTPSDVLSEVSTPVSSTAHERQHVVSDRIVGIHEQPCVGLRVRRRGPSNRGRGGTITQLAPDGRLSYVRWDDPDEADLSGAGGGFEMFPTSSLSGHALAVLTPRQGENGGGGKRTQRLRAAIIIGRDCEVQVGLRVMLLDPLQDLRECSQATNAVIHAHGLPPHALGIVVRILHGTSRLFPDAFVEWVFQGEAAGYPCGKDNVFALKRVAPPVADPFADFFQPADDWQHWQRLGMVPLADPQTGKGSLTSEHVYALCRILLEQDSKSQHSRSSGSDAGSVGGRANGSASGGAGSESQSRHPVRVSTPESGAASRVSSCISFADSRGVGEEIVWEATAHVPEATEAAQQGHGARTRCVSSTASLYLNRIVNGKAAGETTYGDYMGRGHGDTTSLHLPLLVSDKSSLGASHRPNAITPVKKALGTTWPPKPVTRSRDSSVQRMVKNTMQKLMLKDLAAASPSRLPRIGGDIDASYRSFVA